MEPVNMDYLNIEGKGPKPVNVLLITDHFTRFAQRLYNVQSNCSSSSQSFVGKFICYLGIPERILTDQGKSFESALVAELCALAGVRKIHTTPYHDMTNGQCERFNKTLISMVGTLVHEKKIHWKQYVKPLVFAYNSMRHQTTGYIVPTI